MSPREEQWLKTEYDDTIAANGGRYTQRAASATETRAWSIRIAKPRALAIKNELALVATPLNRAQETREWTKIAALLTDYEFWQAVEDLRHQGVIDKQHLRFLGGEYLVWMIPDRVRPTDYSSAAKAPER